MNFDIRKNADGLNSLPSYASDGLQPNGEYTGNPFFPEYAPISAGGDLRVAKGNYKGDAAKGNCTWYTFGRWMEVFGNRPERPIMRADAHLWGNGDGAILSNNAEIGGIVVFRERKTLKYGHVAFIETIIDGKAYLSESSYSESGNGFLFKYGRTIEQVCQEWNMEVLRYIAPYEKSTSETKPSKPSESGTTFTFKGGTPIYKNDETLYEIQPKNDYTATVVRQSGDWTLIRVNEFDPKEVWVKSADIGLSNSKPSTPAPKPQVVDRTGQTLIIYPSKLLGSKMVNLYTSANFDKTYPKGIDCSDGEIRYYKILKQISDGRYLIRVPKADPTDVYIEWRTGIGFKD